MITEPVTTNGIREPARPDHLSRSPDARPAGGESIRFLELGARYPEVISPPYAAIFGTLVVYPVMVAMRSGASSRSIPKFSGRPAPRR